MSPTAGTITTATRPQIDIAIDWAAAEGWNPGHHDADCYHVADPHGFLIAHSDETPVATIAAIKYDRHFGFLGFYLVAPPYRGQGYGLRIWQAALAYLQGCTIGLDGVVAQQHNYMRSGFVLAFRNIRYAGRATGAPDNDATVPLADLPGDAVSAYDGPFFPADRNAFSKKWITQPGCIARGIARNGHLRGYGVCRACRNGNKIRPLYADSPREAAQLFASLSAAVPAGEALFLDVPQPNRAAVALAERHDMHPVFETARMYRGTAPALPLDRLFGITSFEIG